MAWKVRKTRKTFDSNEQQLIIRACLLQIYEFLATDLMIAVLAADRFLISASPLKLESG